MKSKAMESRAQGKLVGLVIAGVLALLLVGTIVWITKPQSEPPTTGAFAGLTAEVYYSPNCGCCANYISYLKKNSVYVKTVSTTDTNSIKAQMNIPRSLWSCHTTKIGEYFIEGHVPIEAIKKLLDEKPDIDGIALPGMPSGSPGMPGPKTEPFEIQAVKDGKGQGLFVSLG